MNKGQQLSKKQLKKLKQQSKKQEAVKQSYEKHEKIDQNKEASQQQQLVVGQNEDIDFNQLQDDNKSKQSDIDVTFLIAQIREEYYHSMKTVLFRFAQIVGITQSQIASQVLEKANYGNVVVAEDDDEDQQDEDQDESSSSSQQQNKNEVSQQDDQLNVYSILTILPSSSTVSNKIRKLAVGSLQKQKSLKNYKQVNQILSSNKNCSVMVNSRLPNLPSFIMADSHEVFLKDLQQHKSTATKLQIFNSEYILNVSEVQIQNSQSLTLDDIIFSKFQDYEFCQKSVAWWIGQNLKSQRLKADLRRIYFVIKYKDYLSCIKNIRGYLQDQKK